MLKQFFVAVFVKLNLLFDDHLTLSSLSVVSSTHCILIRFRTTKLDIWFGAFDYRALVCLEASPPLP